MGEQTIPDDTNPHVYLVFTGYLDEPITTWVHATLDGARQRATWWMATHTDPNGYWIERAHPEGPSWRQIDYDTDRDEGSWCYIQRREVRP